MKRILALLALTLLCHGMNAEKIKGTVRDTDGRAISGVVVSDGLNTTLTDSKGRFHMDADQDSRFVFISTPSGYTSATLRGGELFYKELGDRTGTYDFVLAKNREDDTRHNIVVIADPQISERDELPQLGNYAEDIAGTVRGLQGYTFGLCLGDIVGWDHSIYPEYNDIMSTTGIDYRYVIGNHDMTCYGRSFETSTKDYQDMYGPAWYSFNVGKVHYVVLNDNFYVGRDYFYIGYLDERQLRWLESDLSHVPEGSRVILSMHIPSTLDKSDRDAFRYNVIADNLCNKTALYSMLEPYRTLILSGHMHTSDHEVISGNISEHNIAGLCGAWWCGPVCIDGTPIGYKVYEIDGDDISWTYKGCGYPADYQMKVYVDAPLHEGYVVAHVWDYDPQWKVEYFEDGIKVCDMERFTAQDPLAKECYKDPSSLKRSWVYAAPTDNMFRAHTSPEAKNAEIRVTDRFGRIYSHIFPIFGKIY